MAIGKLKINYKP